MEPVLLDASGGTAAGRALAAQPPAELVDGHLDSAACSGRVSSNAAAIAAHPPPMIATLMGSVLGHDVEGCDHDTGAADPPPLPPHRGRSV